MLGLGAGVADGRPDRDGRSVEFVQGTAVAGDTCEDGGSVAEAYGTTGSDVDDALCGGEGGGMDGTGDVAYVDGSASAALP